MNIAIVTGASSGLGMEFAVQIDKEYELDEIWLIARRKDQMESVVDKLQHAKGVVLPLDLTSSTDMATLSKKIKKNAPDIKILVNNAGLGAVGQFKDLDLDVNLKMIDLNIKALVELTGLCIPFIHDGGLIIQVGSINGFMPGMPNWSVYAATKAFVISFSNALYQELKPSGIHVLTVSPGAVKTEFSERASQGNVDLPNFGVQPSEVVSAALKDVKKKRINSIYGMATKFNGFLYKMLSRKSLLKIAAASAEGSQPADKYYLYQQEKLLKNLDKMLRSVRKALLESYDKAFSETIVKETREEYINLIPLFPYVGGNSHPMMTQKITWSAWCLALYRVMKKHGKSVNEIGKVIYDSVEKDCNAFPKKILIQLNGKLTFTKYYLKLLRNMEETLEKRKYPESGLIKVIEGDGKDFNYGMDFYECPVHKFFHANGADDITPFVCFTDLVFSKASRTGLYRTTNLAEGGEKCDFRWKKGRAVKVEWPPAFLEKGHVLSN